MEIKITDNNTTENFLERYKDKSVWHLAWSLYWRGYLVMVEVVISLYLLFVFLEAIFS